MDKNTSPSSIFATVFAAFNNAWVPALVSCAEKKRLLEIQDLDHKEVKLVVHSRAGGGRIYLSTCEVEELCAHLQRYFPQHFDVLSAS